MRQSKERTDLRSLGLEFAPFARRAVGAAIDGRVAPAAAQRAQQLAWGWTRRQSETKPGGVHRTVGEGKVTKRGQPEIGSEGRRRRDGRRTRQAKQQRLKHGSRFERPDKNRNASVPWPLEKRPCVQRWHCVLPVSCWNCAARRTNNERNQENLLLANAMG